MPAPAQNYPPPKDGSWTARDFRFHTGETMAELGLLDKEIKRIKNGRALVIPGSADTFGHGTTGQAKFWKAALAELLQSAPKLTD